MGFYITLHDVALRYVTLHYTSTSRYAHAHTFARAPSSFMPGASKPQPTHASALRAVESARGGGTVVVHLSSFRVPCGLALYVSLRVPVRVEGLVGVLFFSSRFYKLFWFWVRGV